MEYVNMSWVMGYTILPTNTGPGWMGGDLDGVDYFPLRIGYQSMGEWYRWENEVAVKSVGYATLGEKSRWPNDPSSRYLSDIIFRPDPSF